MVRFLPLPHVVSVLLRDTRRRKELPSTQSPSPAPGISTSSHPSEFSGARFPPELLSYIFSLLPSESSTFSLQSTPWTLSRVCRFWRNVALATPFLWSSISIDTRDDTLWKNLQGCIQMLSSVLDHSKDQPLDVEILISVNPFNSSNRWQILFSMLHDHGHRWRSLVFRISLCLIHTAIDIGQPPVCGYKILESVKLCSIDRSRDHLMLCALQRAPLLKKAILLSSNALSQPTTPPTLPWNQLLYLDIPASHVGPISELQLLSVLSQSTSLQTLIIRHDRICFDGNAPFNSSPIRIDTLRTFELHHHPQRQEFAITYDRWLTSRLTLPNLQNLVLHNVRWNMGNNLTCLISMLERSACRLQTLSVTGIHVADVTIERLLRSPEVGEVTKLKLEGHPGGYLFDRIASDESLIPRLTQLCVYMAHGGDVVLTPPIRNIVNLVRSRARVLKVVNLDFYWHTHDIELVHQLREFDNVRVGRLEHDSALKENPRLRDEILAIRQLGGIFKKTLVLSHRMWNGRANLVENMPAVSQLFNELEHLLQSISLTDAEVMWVGEAHYVLLVLASRSVSIPRDAEFELPERASRLLESFTRSCADDEKEHRRLSSSLRKRWQVVRKAFSHGRRPLHM
ncbi:hypothetical protein E1B28_003654 [Marasmius oreades]|uniref:F-box domain-containing protein n=1 Tax=Marasmius oreades TaxID=181124 RepID=A0A9P7UX05_9AGAR|nr:uncharacterized protein E1B28_003654 [Marasmius oreades]KAG7096203.1 hypothetical protein E1B28_003654 [Marasmius oreades]